MEATRFLPGGSDGQAVQCEVIFNVEFKLDEKTKLAYKENMRNPELAEARLKDMLSPGFDGVNTQVSDLADQSDTSISSTQLMAQNFECNIEVCPKPIGGLKAILDNLFFPQHILRLGAEGNVSVLADVDEYGLVGLEVED